MECKAEAAALLPSFRELTSAGVVGRDRNGSPSDGSTDGSQQSQVCLMIFLLVSCLGWSMRLPNLESIRRSISTTVAMEITRFTFFYKCCSCRQRRRNRRPNWVKNSACLRHTPWFSFRSRLHIQPNRWWSHLYEKAPFWWKWFLFS